jgi:hypothetical protein
MKTTSLAVGVAAPAPAPVLEALAAFEAATQQAHDAGVEAATLKGLLRRLEENIQGLMRRLETSTHEPMMAALEEELAALREARATSTALLEDIQARRVRYEQQAMELRETYTELAGRAKAAYYQWRQATRTAQSETAYQRYKAQRDQATAQSALAQLVGAKEAQRCATDAQSQPDWLKD